jgi:hypothetical protein
MRCNAEGNSNPIPAAPPPSAPVTRSIANKQQRLRLRLHGGRGTGVSPAGRVRNGGAGFDAPAKKPAGRGVDREVGGGWLLSWGRSALAVGGLRALRPERSTAGLGLRVRN